MPKQRFLGNPHPDDQIEANIRDEESLKKGLCPYCNAPVKIMLQTATGYCFRCPNHGTCGRATRSLALCFTKEKK